MTEFRPLLNLKNSKERNSEGAIDLLASRILVVEDELKLQEHLAQFMFDEGFSVFTCDSYKKLEHMLTLPARFDIVILDRLLHGRDSAELLPEIKRTFESKVMILSAIGTSSEKAALLDLGADDYVAKPFAGDELVARVRVLLRRHHTAVGLGDIVLNPETRTIKVSGQESALPNKEYLLLRTLVLSPGKVFNKIDLYKSVWEMSEDVESNVVETTVNKLRRRLKEAGSKVQIRNVRNAGYWIEE